MTDEQLRVLVRDAVARHLGDGSPPHPDQGGAVRERVRVPQHASHAMFVLPAAGDDARCVIEPGVTCTHCGYCKSYGH